MLLALWDGYDERILRFQLNRLVSGEQISAARASRRAPTHAPVRVLVGGREKPGTLYSLSEGGCFVETPRASMDGARLRRTNLSGADLSSASGLDQRQLDDACGNAATKLPRGLSVRACQ